MKKILFFALVALLSLGTQAQTAITNGNMEGWLNPSQNTAEPIQWNSTKTSNGPFTAFTPQTCWRDTSTLNGGTYSAKIVSGSALGVVVNGALATGRIEAPSTDKSQGYINSIRNNPDFAMTFTGRPDSLVFWYRFTKQGTDYPKVEARLHVGNAYTPETPVSNNHPDSTVNIISRAAWQGAASSVATWTRISVPFVYVDNRTPQYILVSCTSSGDQLNGTSGSTLWLDEFQAIYNPTIATGTINPLSYYVSAAQGASVSVPYTITGTFVGGNTFTAELSDANGSFASPVTIGSVTSTTSGTIAATIPAGTATGAGYRIRVKSSTPALTAADNGTNISITLVSTSVAPSTVQNIAAGVNGGTLTVTETPAAVSREWKFSTTSGSGYQSFGTPQTGTTYAPNFANPGTYYVVAVSAYAGGLNITSNQVQINVVGNSIAPTASQSILVGVNGTQLTVTETPAGTWREWSYGTVSGGPYTNVIAGTTGSSTYTPNFASAGNYYVVCKSTITGVDVTSNEVLVSVGNATITTGSISGSPFLFSPSAPDAAINVPFTTSGTFNNGNVFTAQLSDVTGSFTAAVNIGTLTATSSGTISALFPHTTPAGTGYRIRVVSNNPVVLGSDNGVDLTVDQFNNSVAPPNAQTIMHGVNGTALAVFASQQATNEWKYSTTSGSGYISFTPAETNSSYTPNFATPGTYYVVAVSKNQYNDEVTSNEVQIDVTNGTTITTSAVSGSPFDVSPNMPANVTVNFTSDAVFNAGNVFTAQLSDFAGSFANPITIGTLNGSTIGSISGVIPGNSAGGSAYRIRVVSTDPAITGSDNGSDLTLNPFENSIAPLDTQRLAQAQSGTALTVTESQTATHVWKYSEVSGLGYSAFNPSQTGATYTPAFNLVSTYYVICESTNQANDKVSSPEVVIIVTAPSGISEARSAYIKAYWIANNLMVDLTAAQLSTPVIELMNTTGQVVLTEKLNANALNTIGTMLNNGMYMFKITDGSQSYSGKTSKN